MTQVDPNLQDNTSPEDDIDLVRYLDLFLSNKWLILSIMLGCLIIGGLYAFFGEPVYESDIVIQVEDNTAGVASLLGQSVLGQASDMLDIKTAANAEIEIIRSRFVVSQAVDNVKLYIQAQPKYFPLFGAWFANRAKSLSQPGLFGYGGYAWGTEKIDVPELEVPLDYQGQDFTLTANGDGGYKLIDPKGSLSFDGRVGVRENFLTPSGPVKILVHQLSANAGTNFTVTGYSRLKTIEDLQDNLRIAEKGKQSGVIGASLRGTDPILTTRILNEVGKEYIKQNVERKSAEAEQSLEFLNSQLPQLKKELENAEDRYTTLRGQRGTVNLGEEAKITLQQAVDSQTQMFELRQKRQELLTRFTPQHPSILALNQQIDAVAKQLDLVGVQIKNLPSLEQDVLRVTRDVKVSTDLYATLLNNTQQLRLIKAGRVGNARLIDQAVVPEIPVAPQKAVVLIVSVLFGLLFGAGVAALKGMLFGGISDSHDVESHTGLSVYSTVPYSKRQGALAANIAAGIPNGGLLAQEFPNEPAIEALRSLRTALQFAMLGAKNNIVVLTGPSPQVGKSFVSSNFSAVTASAGKRILLIDGDIRKGYLNKYFGIGRELGLSELIAGTITIEQAIRRNLPSGVDFMPTGSLPPNPAEVLLSPHVSELLERIAKEYDIVIIDTPPVLAAADTAILASHAGTVLLLARFEKTTVGEIKECIKRLSHSGVEIKGVLFNGVDPNNRTYGSRYGRYRYSTYNYYNADER